MQRHESQAGLLPELNAVTQHRPNGLEKVNDDGFAWCMHSNRISPWRSACKSPTTVPKDDSVATFGSLFKSCHDDRFFSEIADETRHPKHETTPETTKPEKPRNQTPYISGERNNRCTKPDTLHCGRNQTPYISTRNQTPYISGERNQGTFR